MYAIIDLVISIVQVQIKQPFRFTYLFNINFVPTAFKIYIANDDLENALF